MLEGVILNGLAVKVTEKIDIPTFASDQFCLKNFTLSHFGFHVEILRLTGICVKCILIVCRSGYCVFCFWRNAWLLV